MHEECAKRESGIARSWARAEDDLKVVGVILDGMEKTFSRLLAAIAEDARSTGPFKINFSNNLLKAYAEARDLLEKYRPKEARIKDLEI
jgi:hypothetical protein